MAIQRSPVQEVTRVGVRLILLSLLLPIVACGEAFDQSEILPEEIELEAPAETPGQNGEENYTQPEESLSPTPSPTPTSTPSATPAPSPTPPPKAVSNNSSPALDPDFSLLPNGKKLSSLKVKGSSLSLAKGSGQAFTESKRQQYLKLKQESQSDPNHPVQWVLMDLDSRRVIEKSLSSHKRIFGASSSKIYVGAALLDQKRGDISSSQLQLMADMLVVSSNTAWTNLQKQIGDGDSNRGRERIHQFTQKMGYLETRGFQGYWGKMHGNELVPDEVVETLYDMYTNAFPGAETIWKIMHACRTGASRGRKYIPRDIYVGGKTGTYSGSTENPETGKQYNVRIKNHVMVFNVGGRQYGLAVLANSGSDESAALLAGGLIREL